MHTLRSEGIIIQSCLLAPLKIIIAIYNIVKKVFKYYVPKRSLRLEMKSPERFIE